MKKNIEPKKTFSLLVLAFFVVFFAFSIFTVLSGILSFAELEGWDGKTIATEFASGNGSEENPYVIHNAAQFMYFKSLVEGDTFSSYQDKYYVLDSDIDFGGYDITPIGIEVPKEAVEMPVEENGEETSIEETETEEAAVEEVKNVEDRIFKGTLDGKGYSLMNFKIREGTALEGKTYYAFFSKVEEGTITRINLDNYRIEVPEDVDAVISGLVGNQQKGMIEDVTLRNFYIHTHNNADSVVGIIAGESDEVKITKVYVDGEVNGSSQGFVRYFDKGESTFILSRLTYDGILEHENVKDLYFVKDGKILLEDTEVSEVSLLALLNDGLEADYYWAFDQGVFKFSTHELDVVEVPEESKEFAFSIQDAPSITVHDTGRDGTSVYVNDLVADYNYYMGLNYTELTSTNGTLPNGENQGLYSNSNLATVYIRYSAYDINDSSIYGAISTTENYREMYYYKRYPVVNGYVEFDLIDSPWGSRPNNRAFNGWVTDDPNAVITLDIETYTRHVKIPVTNVSSVVSITFYSSWTTATVATTTGSLGDLKVVGMNSIPSSWEDVSGYFITAHVNNGNNYPNVANLYDMSGNSITAGSACNTTGGCDFYRRNTTSTYNASTVYYMITPGTGGNPATIEIYAPKKYPITYYSENARAAGYFKAVTSGTENIYNSSGEKLASCSYGTCYQLLQYSDGIVDPNTTYYYLTTRDTNLFVPSTTNTINTSNISTSRPMTITGMHNGSNNANNRTIYLNGDWTINSDLRIEHIRFYTNTTSTTVTNLTTDNYEIIGNYHNLKIGRGLVRYTANGRTYLTAGSFIGGSSSSATSLRRYTTIIESGWYQAGSGIGYYSTQTHRVNANVVLGNDYDRVVGTNDALIVYYCYAGSWASNLYNSSSSSNTYDFPAIVTTVKSGSFGTNQGDYAAGVYAGGRGSGTHYALRSVIVEGGYIFNLIGGPVSADGRAGKNDVILNVKGGTVSLIVGGAGASDTVGNRILNITGGTIEYGILGGSNAYTSGNSSNPYGKIDGDTLVYVGGNVTVGNQTDSLYNVASGNVFGAGNGRQGELDVGSVNNSNVIIGPSATIKGSVYGGGNFGAVGGSTATNATYDGNTSGGGDTPTDTGGVYIDSTADANIRYYGTNPDNYIRFNNETYRIVGLFYNVETNNGTEDLVRLVKTTRNGNGNYGWITNNSYITNGNNRVYSNYFVRNDNDDKSNMYNYLNTTYYGALNATSQGYIQAVNWPMGAIASNVNTAPTFYSAEHGSTPGSSYSVTSYNSNVGLLYASDFGFANNSSTCLTTNLSAYAGTCANSNWISSMITNNAWTMTPSTYSENIYQRTGRTYDSYHVFYIGTAHNLYRNNVAYYSGGYVARTYAVYPSFYLKSDLTIASGTGTQGDPYVIGTGDQLLTDIIYGLAHPDNPEIPDDYEPVEDDGIYQEATDYVGRTHVQILGGTIQQSVYGAGNNNGSGTIGNNNRIALTKVTIDMDGGTVGDSVYGGANEMGTVYGDVLININNGTVTNSVYGGGKGGYSGTSNGTYVSRDVDVNIGSASTTALSIGRNVYGGSAFGTVNGIGQNEGENSHHVRVTVNAGVVTGSVFGGGEGDSTYVPKEYGNIYVHVNGGSMTNVFGGNDSRGEPGNIDIVYLNGGTIGNAFGGGNNTGQTYSDIRLQGSTISGNLYGGSNNSGEVASTHVTVSSGMVTEVFGGNNLGGSAGNTHVNVTGGMITTAVYGGGKQAEATTTATTVTGCTVPSVYGGGKNAGVDATTTVIMNNATATAVFGGSNASGDVANSSVRCIGSTIGSVYGGNNSGGETDAAHVRLETSTIGNVFGGGDNATTGTSSVIVDSGLITNVFGGGNEAGVTTTDVKINGGTIANVYGGSNTQGDIDSANVAINGGTITTAFGGNNLGGETDVATITSTGGSVGTLYGGGNEAIVGETTLSLDSLTAGTIYGGGNQAIVRGDVTCGISNSTASGHVYGGGNAAGVNGGVSLEIDSSTITGNVYGGGNEGVVQHNTDVHVSDTTVSSNIFAGGNGATAIVYGNSTVTIDGSTVVGNSTTVAPNAGCVFGSGNAAATGSDGHPSVATVNIVGGEIFGNVYGGAKMSVVYGVTDTNIGTAAVNKNGLVEDDIHIHGTVFGGGESNASGSEVYDYTFISVTDGITVDIDGTGYIDHSHDFIINGSIFGSGNASSSAGDSDITIKNLGTMAQPNRAISIQRVTNLVIDSSVIELMGATDRTNDLVDFLYSFNQIDYLVIKNNTTLFLQHNANLLKEIYSGVDVGGTLTKATVTIDDDTKTVTKNVDNRIYMVPGENLHIAVNQSATAYGRVNGMTFYGMYTSGDSNNYRLGLYDPQYDYGDSGNASLELVGGSYVVGLKYTNHNIKVDGFYTNILDDETYSEIVTKYIDPSRIGDTGYRWIIGFEAINYTVPLIISKYSSLGTYELSMIDFAEGNTTFTILGFDATGLENDVQLIDSNLVPRIADTEEEANSILGLSMKVETQEWTSTGTTKFYSVGGGDYSGGDEYVTDSRQVAPSAMFYAYHAKNFSRTTGDMGDCIITMQVAIPKNEIEFDIKFVTITVELSARSHDEGPFYDASITYDKKYEMPAATDVYITNQSQFTAYFSLTDFFDNYAAAYGQNNEFYRVLTFSNPLPANTMITMMDFGSNSSRPEYYYYRISQADYTASVTEWETYGEVAYPLLRFIKMDSTSTNNTYNDAAANLLYYDTTTDMVDEEFLFIVDMKETTATGEHLDNHVSFELRNADNWAVINVVSGRDALMVYNTFDSSNVVLSQTFADVDSYLYYNVPDVINYSTEILYNETENRQSIIDTNYEFSSMGLNVTIIDRTGEPVSSSLLVGTNIVVGNHEYYADGKGVFRIKLANKVSNINRNLNLVIGRNLPAGNYTVRYTLFASEDGLHNSTYQNSVTEEFNVTVVSSSSYIAVSCEDETKLVYGETGLNHGETRINTYTVEYVSELSNPNFRVEIYKRNTDNINSTVYQSVAFSTLFTNNYTSAGNGNEVILPVVEDDEEDFDFQLATNLTSGTYRVVFRLYDNNQLIDEDIKNVIVQKKID